MASEPSQIFELLSLKKLIPKISFVIMSLTTYRDMPKKPFPCYKYLSSLTFLWAVPQNPFRCEIFLGGSQKPFFSWELCQVPPYLLKYTPQQYSYQKSSCKETTGFYPQPQGATKVQLCIQYFLQSIIQNRIPWLQLSHLFPQQRVIVIRLNSVTANSLPLFIEAF